MGKPVAGVEVKIAADGEILTRGPNVMKGYYNNPRRPPRRSTPTAGSTPATSARSRDGFLAITDRKKDIIVTAGGKNIAPQPIENLVKTNKFVSQAVMIGDKRAVPDHADRAELRAARELGEAQGTSSGPTRAAPRDARRAGEDGEGGARRSSTGWRSSRCRRRSRCSSSDFTLETGEMTPTLKVKRRVVDKNYKDVIDAMYAGRDELTSACRFSATIAASRLARSDITARRARAALSPPAQIRRGRARERGPRPRRCAPRRSGHAA